MTGLKVATVGLGISSLTLPLLAQTNAAAIEDGGITERLFEFLATGSAQVVLALVVIGLTVYIWKQQKQQRQDNLDRENKHDELLVKATETMSSVSAGMASINATMSSVQRAMDRCNDRREGK